MSGKGQGGGEKLALQISPGSSSFVSGMSLYSSSMRMIHSFRKDFSSESSGKSSIPCSVHF